MKTNFKMLRENLKTKQKNKKQKQKKKQREQILTLALRITS
jgi:hypothetical protein